ncbi:flagellar biosynthesis anti-sigma factor FlgM [Sutcliffiella horikoshii]|uniref:flagellar biosynthesis anti-sigma factor FlgM n=1 Tax=Sutcliffiella horikoshii TaxID=79883 RepID=UPI00203EA4CB|nr:flagellar biosynthesis anti-sigma factor FlgM [Sutcliffiella horikoshii]MCM3618770.1 flagellar biosynthesis anti-sigma factor FlgM [Sutcliffiella horikoshii]
MKINNIGSSGVNPYKNHMKQQQMQTPNQAKSDQVEISNKAKEMQERSQFTEARQEQIAKLKVSVENGTYKVDPKAVSSKMIDFYFNK